MMDPDFTWQEVGNRIRSLRIAAGIAQYQLAAKASLSQPALARVEGGEREPQLDTLRKIAGALQVPVRRLVSGEGDQSHHAEVHAEVNMVLNSGNAEAITAFRQGLQLAKFLVGNGRSRTSVRLKRDAAEGAATFRAKGGT